MAEKSKRIKKKLVKKYRLVVLTESSYEEKFSFKLTRLNVFVFGGIFSLLLIVFTIALVVYTPIKEYIPGFESPDLKKKTIALNFELDSLTNQIHSLELYTESMKPVLLGNKAIEMEVLPFVTKKGEAVYQSGIVNNDSVHAKLDKLYTLLDQKNTIIKALQQEYKSIYTDSAPKEAVLGTSNKTPLSDELASLESSALDSMFRENVAREERFSIFGHEYNKINQVFVSPALGSITQDFDLTENHFAIDIATDEDAPVKATTDGVVAFAEWSVETGFVVVLLHQNNYVSIYKHNSRINVSQGALVKMGQIIAHVGSTGELSTGPHLHFEMWKDGYAVNPTNFMKF